MKIKKWLIYSNSDAAGFVRAGIVGLCPILLFMAAILQSFELFIASTGSGFVSAAFLYYLNKKGRL